VLDKVDAVEGPAPTKNGHAGTVSTVAAAYAFSLVDFASTRGADRSELLTVAGLDAAASSDRNARLPFDNYKALMKAAKRLTGDEALALHFGESVDMTQVSIVGGIGAACETIADAFVMLGRYARLLVDVELEEHANGERLILERRGKDRWLVDLRKNPDDFPELTESSFARMVTSTARFTGRSFVKAVHVTHPAPSYRCEYDRIFGAPVQFESRRNALVLNDDSWMRLNAPLPSHPVVEVLSEKADALIRDLDTESTLKGRTLRVLESKLQGGDISMDGVAAALGVSRSTLRRRLATEKASFSEVLEELRQARAERLLDVGDLALSQIAHALGFSELASFSRAYKRWTGKSPKARRQGAAANRL
jgi:AraC-like DNA-binding protein